METEDPPQDRNQMLPQPAGLVQPIELALTAFSDPSVLAMKSDEELRDLWSKAEAVELVAIELRSAVAVEMKRRYSGIGEAWYKKAGRILGTHWRRAYDSALLWEAFHTRQEDLQLVGKTSALACAEADNPATAIDFAVAEIQKGRSMTAIGREVRRIYGKKKKPAPAEFGPKLRFRYLEHEPLNELGVVFLFGIVAEELGFFVEGVRSEFPDCHAKRKVATGRLRNVRIEFEFLSSNFSIHHHSPDGCDVIVCWEHDWANCPSELEVIELKSAIKELDD